MFFLQGPSKTTHLWLALAALGVILSLVIYFMLGRLAGGPRETPAPMPPHAMPANAPQPPGSVESMVERLAKRLEQEPDNAEGWVMLGRSYAALGRFEPAAKAYQRAASLQPANPDVLADYADVLAMTQGGDLAGEPEAVALRAVKVDPKHPKALALAGTAAYRRGEFKTAIDIWEKALPGLPPGAEMRHSLERSIADAREKLARPRGAS